MQLMMYLGNDLIEAVTVNDQDLKRYLKQKYEDLLKTSPEPPEFLVCNPDLKPVQPGDTGQQ